MRENRRKLIQLMRALNRIDDQYYRVQRELGLKESLFVLLYMCADGEERSQKAICDEWCIPRTTLNTTVKEQEAAGRVELVPCGNKQKLVKLTESGYAYAEELLGPLLDAEERAGAFIDDGLVEGLERFGGQLEREFGEMGDTAS
ncbi:MAG: winged helix-turn-helix transcriptional regulator [Eggerthellaceae bacterium]|jgi:DNA-binding MarR family transcriptional regulator|nr:winged helix-turn-helix transcriptional regulator [Eggerthellaceae bacterium]